MAGINQNLQYLIKGGIILFACALDMRKYLVPVKPYIAPAREKTRMVVASTLTPETRAASSLEPSANIFLPKVVLFQINQIIAVSKMAKMT